MTKIQIIDEYNEVCSQITKLYMQLGKEKNVFITWAMTRGMARELTKTELIDKLDRVLDIKENLVRQIEALENKKELVKSQDGADFVQKLKDQKKIKEEELALVEKDFCEKFNNLLNDRIGIDWEVSNVKVQKMIDSYGFFFKIRSRVHTGSELSIQILTDEAKEGHDKYDLLLNMCSCGPQPIKGHCDAHTAIKAYSHLLDNEYEIMEWLLGNYTGMRVKVFAIMKEIGDINAALADSATVYKKSNL